MQTSLPEHGILFDGAKAVDLSQIKSGTNLFNVLTGGSSAAARLYSTQGYLYRCVEMRAAAVAASPFRIERASDGEVVYKSSDDKMPDELMFLKVSRKRGVGNNFLYKLFETELALCISEQGAFWFKESRGRRVVGTRWLLPTTVQPYVDVRLGLTHFDRTLVDSQVPRQLRVEDVVFFRRPSNVDEIRSGDPPAKAALLDANVLLNYSTFAQMFFERGAIKATILTYEGRIAEPEKHRLRNWWNNIMTGLRNAFRTEIVNARVKPVVIGEGIKELSDNKLSEEKRQGIAVAMGIPYALLAAQSAGLGAETLTPSMRLFYESTIIPECNLIIAPTINEQLLNQMGYHLVFDHQQLSIFQEDETKRAASLNSFVNAIVAAKNNGINPQAVLTIFGYDMPKDLPLFLPLPSGVDSTEGGGAGEIAPSSEESSKEEQGARSREQEEEPAGEGRFFTEAELRALARRELGSKAAQSRRHEYGTIQFDMPSSVRRSVTKLQEQIDSADLTGKGLEDQPHLTIRYGLNSVDLASAEVVAAQFEPITIQFEGFISLFEKDEFDVVMVRPSADKELTRLHEAFSEAMDCIDLNRDYAPHVTVAYVKKGKGIEYSQKLTPNLPDIVLSVVRLIAPDDSVSFVQLGKKQATGNRQQTTDNKKSAEITNWQRKALKAVRAGKSADVRFDAQHIDPAQRVAISSALACDCARHEPILKAIFDAAPSAVAAKNADIPETSPLRGLFSDLESKFGKEWTRIRKVQLAKLQELGSADAILAALANEQFMDQWGDDLLPTVAALIENATEATVKAEAARLSAEMALDVDWMLVNQRTAEWSRNHAAKLVKRKSKLFKQTIAETDIKAIRTQLANWIEAGEAMPALNKRLAKIVTDASRAELIASTETTRVYGHGVLETWKEAGLIDANMLKLAENHLPIHPRCRCWLSIDPERGIIHQTAQDEIRCPRCQPLQGTVIVPIS